MSKLTLIVVLFTMFLFPLSISAQKVQQKGVMKKPFVFSQQFKHSVGAGVSFYEVMEGYDPVFSLAYNPSLSLTKSWTDFSISVGSQLMGGYHFSSESNDTAFVFADLPLLIEFNFGHNASKDFYNDLGWFIGGGYSYHLFKDSWNSGPVASIGVRSFFFGPSFTIRYSRYFAMQSDDASLHNITLLLNMGKYFEQVKLNNKVSRFTNGRR